MLTLLEKVIKQSNYAGIANIARGVEKESLRVTAGGMLARSLHPKSLGSALMHPQITTDGIEALLELVTMPSQNIHKTLADLDDLHTFTYQHIGDELLWVTSMPCQIKNDNDILISRYGHSNLGKLKTIYRAGLECRYGRKLTIAGTHYNFSVADEFWQFLREHENSTLTLQAFKNEKYFHLIRNFLRYFWVLLYLFGASPSICKSLLGARSSVTSTLELTKILQNTLCTPYATSLRMSNIGFNNPAQSSLAAPYQCLRTYIETLTQAINQPYDAYVEKGIKNAQGDYQQLSDKLLQIENEFYGVIRPKRSVHKGESELSALGTRGVEYIEVRCMDINPFSKLGINQQQIEFLDTFLMYCLLTPSPALHPQDYEQIQYNQQHVALYGRKPDLLLIDQQQHRPMREWANTLLSEMADVAQVLDQASSQSPNKVNYHASLLAEQEKLNNDEYTFSARILKEMDTQGVDFTTYAMGLSQQRKDYFCSQSFDKQQEYTDLVQYSINKQQNEETQQDIGFEEYLQRYYLQYSKPEAAIL